MNSRVQSAREDKEIAGCRLESLIYESSRTLVYRAIRHQDGRRVVVKTLNQEYPSLKTLARLQHEYRVLRHLRSSGTVHAYGLEKHTNNLALILEDCDALPLSALIQTSQSVSMDLFFAIATQLARIVGEVHGAHIIHKDISPDNVLWHPQREELKLIDFDSSLPGRRQRRLDLLSHRQNAAQPRIDQYGHSHGAITGLAQADCEERRGSLSELARALARS